MSRVGRGIELSSAGDREAARKLFGELWEEIGPDGDPLHRCAVAHHLADLQDDPQQEVLWDSRALEAADLLTDERAAAAGVASPVAGLYPSLHLNLGEAYRKLGDLDEARRHLDQGLAAATALGDDGYGAMVRRGLSGLADRLDAA
jgi:tetratricopeptide (TPR) repeat protein